VQSVIQDGWLGAVVPGALVVAEEVWVGAETGLPPVVEPAGALFWPAGAVVFAALLAGALAEAEDAPAVGGEDCVAL
jgi:hypothetical protein